MSLKSRDDLKVVMDVSEICRYLIALPRLQTKEIVAATKRNGKADKGALWSRLQQPVHPSQKKTPGIFFAQYLSASKQWDKSNELPCLFLSLWDFQVGFFFFLFQLYISNVVNCFSFLYLARDYLRSSVCNLSRSYLLLFTCMPVIPGLSSTSKIYDHFEHLFLHESELSTTLRPKKCI